MKKGGCFWKGLYMRYKSYSTCDSQGRSQIKEIYETSFPKSEKFPFWVLKQCAKENNVRLDAIIDHNTDKIIGMSFLIFYDDIAYLMYVAIDKKYRNKGFGSLVLRDLILRQVDVSILLCIERPSAKKEDIKARRKYFYLRNGFYETGCFIEDSDVEYEFLSSSKERIITENDLKKRYSCMTRNPLMKFLIKNTFDSNINFY